MPGRRGDDEERRGPVPDLVSGTAAVACPSSRVPTDPAVHSSSAWVARGFGTPWRPRIATRRAVWSPRGPILAAMLLAAMAATSHASSGITLANRDTTCAPCDDFDRYAVGRWKDAHPIPETEAAWNTWEIMRQRAQIAVREICERAAQTSAAPGTPERIVGDYFAAAMDSHATEAAGLSPLREELAAIDGLKDARDLPALVARLHNAGPWTNAFFSFGPTIDAKNSTWNIALLSQSGLGLPDRDYYVRTDAASQRIRDGYRDYLTRLFALAGESPEAASRDAAATLRIETRLATASLTRLERRDLHAQYNKRSVAQLATLTPHIAWSAYWTAVGAPPFDSVNIAQPGFFAVVDSIWATTPLDDLRAYCRAGLLDASADYLPAAFVDASFAFRGRLLQGAPENWPRWRRALDSAELAIGELLGRAYVETHFPPAAKARAQRLVDDVRVAFGERLDAADWMSADTKRAAREKLARLTPRIGYPDTWRDFSQLGLGRDSWMANVKRATRHENHRSLQRIGKPVDRTQWSTTPQTANAFYSPPKNEIVLPAAAFQPPFFDPGADDAVNYGAIGMIIAHEMSHGFDDLGRQRDADGNLREWWGAADVAAFHERAGCIAAHFSGYHVQDTLRVDGRLVVGEAIADLGGVRVARRALDLALARAPQPVIDGYTPAQRFYLSFATVWAESLRPEEERRRLMLDSHPPHRYRTLGTLANDPGFAEAFHCPTGSPMTRDAATRCALW